MNCGSCGAEQSDSARQCSQCGKPFEAGADRWTPSAATQGHAGNVTSILADTPYASFGRRAAASIVDSVILYFVQAALVVGGGAAGLGLSYVFSWLYKALLESSALQGTLGKRLLGIKVTDYDGRRIGFGRATGRFFGQILSSLIFGIGLLMAAFTARRQTLHDMLLSTLVVRRAATEQEITEAGPAPPASAGSIVLVVLLCLVAPVGLIAAIAIPAYQDYSIRAQVAEGLMNAAAAKAAVADYYGRTGKLAANREEAGLPADPHADAGTYVDTIDVADGRLRITYGGKANRIIQGHSLVLTPYESAERALVWRCGRGLLPGEVDAAPRPIVPPGATAGAADPTGDLTEIGKGRYLPASCRTND